MGYLKDFRESFSKRLESLEPEAMQEALNVACNALLESYRNGQKSAREAKKEARESERKSRTWQKRRA